MIQHGQVFKLKAKAWSRERSDARPERAPDCEDQNREASTNVADIPGGSPHYPAAPRVRGSRRPRLDGG